MTTSSVIYMKKLVVGVVGLLFGLVCFAATIMVVPTEFTSLPLTEKISLRGNNPYYWVTVHVVNNTAYFSNVLQGVYQLQLERPVGSLLYTLGVPTSGATLDAYTLWTTNPGTNVSSGGSSPWQYGSTHLTNWAQLDTNILSALSNSVSVVTSNNLPFIYVFTNGSYLKDGVIHANPGTLTCGIQEAIDSLPLGRSGNDSSGAPGGGSIRLGVGIYYTYTNIYVTSVSTNSTSTNILPFSLIIEGVGLAAGGITYVGITTQNVVTVGNHGDQHSSISSFSMRDLWLASAMNARTNLLFLNGINQTSFNDGGVSRASIERCWFGWWTAMTNSPVLSPAWAIPKSSVGDSESKGLPKIGAPDEVKGQQNLIGVNAALQYDDIIEIKSCCFNFLGVGIRWSVDHGVIQECLFENVGNQNIATLTNGWPKTAPESIGPAILFANSWSGSYPNINHNFWNVRGNQFVACPVHYMSTLPSWGAYSPTTEQITWADSWSTVIIHDDTDESGTTTASFVTAGSRAVFVNPRLYDHIPGNFSNDHWNPVVSYFLTNLTDYSTYRNVRTPTNMVTYIDEMYQTNTGPYGFGGAVRAPTFIGSGKDLIGSNYVLSVEATNIHTPMISSGAYLRADGNGHVTLNLKSVEFIDTNSDNITFTGTNIFTGPVTFSGSNLFGNGGGLTNLNAAAMAGAVTNGQTNVSFYTPQLFGVSRWSTPDGDVFVDVFGSDSAFNVTGEVVASSFAGNGSSLTALNASYLASGTVPLDRLPVLTTNLLAPNAPQVGSFLVYIGNGLYAAFTTNVVYTNGLLAVLSNGVVVASMNTNGAVTGGSVTTGNITNIGYVVTAGTNIVTKLLVGGAAAGSDAANITGSLKASGLIANSTSIQAGSYLQGLTGVYPLPNDSWISSGLVCSTTMRATNGVIFNQLPWLPTNSVPSSSATITNYVLVNITNQGPMLIATNYLGAAGSFIKITFGNPAPWP